MDNVDIVQYASDFRDAIIGKADSGRMCAAISGPLAAALSVLGVESSLCETDLGDCNHVFIQLKDGTVLDPTADQFNWCSVIALPKVYFGPGTIIHQNAVQFIGGEMWTPLLQELKRFCPEFSAREVGAMVKLTLETLPARLFSLPG